MPEQFLHHLPKKLKGRAVLEETEEQLEKCDQRDLEWLEFEEKGEW